MNSIVMGSHCRHNYDHTSESAATNEHCTDIETMHQFDSKKIEYTAQKQNGLKTNISQNYVRSCIGTICYL